MNVYKKSIVNPGSFFYYVSRCNSRNKNYRRYSAGRIFPSLPKETAGFIGNSPPQGGSPDHLSLYQPDCEAMPTFGLTRES